MLEAGVEMEIISLHGGEDTFEGHPVFKFNKWTLLRLFLLLPLAFVGRGESLMPIMREMNVRCPPSFLNLFENLLGIGSAFVLEERIRRFSPEVIHCVWAGAPAAFGRVASALTGIPFSSGAHAYDVFEGDGDWLLEEKLENAALIHVSTDVAKERIRTICNPAKVKRIRRGLNTLPEFRLPRSRWDTLRIVCVARLVEKKGFPYQLRIYKDMREAGIPFEAKIIGDGPEDASIRESILELGLENHVSLTGRLSQEEVQEELKWADLLFHTGVVAASGDRDGLPNVVPEAMASGAIVLGSPVSGVVEAIEDDVTGFLCEPWVAKKWIQRCEALRNSFELRERLSTSARTWVEKEFVADRNTGKLLENLGEAIRRS